MSKKFLYSALSVSLSTLLLSACGGSDSNSNNEAVAHIYNVSPNSTKLTLEVEVDDGDTSSYLFSNIDFADASSVTSIEGGTYAVTVSGIDANLEQEELTTGSVSLINDQRNLVILSGDYTDLQLQTFTYDIEDLNEGVDEEDMMRLYLGDFASNSPGYEIRYSNSSDSFADAVALTTTTPGSVALVGDFETETYNIYVVDPTTDQPLFTAQDVSMTGETAYLLMLRDSFGPAQAGLALDKVTSSTTVVDYEDALGDAQYRLFNVAPNSVDVTLSSSDSNFESLGLSQGSTTAYEKVGYSDYAVSIKEGETDLLSNLALSLPQNTSKGVAIYQDYDADTDTSETKSMSFEESVRELKYQSDVNFINLAYDVEQADVFFVAPGETMDTAQYDFQNVDYEELENDVLPNDTYRINVVLDLDDDSRSILNQTDIELEDGKNYTLILYKDDTSQFGYNLLIASE